MRRDRESCVSVLISYTSRIKDEVGFAHMTADRNCRMRKAFWKTWELRMRSKTEAMIDQDELKRWGCFDREIGPGFNGEVEQYGEEGFVVLYGRVGRVTRDDELLIAMGANLIFSATGECIQTIGPVVSRKHRTMLHHSLFERETKKRWHASFPTSSPLVSSRNMAMEV